jgi:hypothetical protein
MMADVRLSIEIELDDEAMDEHREYLEGTLGKEDAKDLMSDEFIEQEIVDDFKHCEFRLPIDSLIGRFISSIRVTSVDVD